MALVEGNTKATGYGQSPPRPPVWDASIGTYRDPQTGNVAIGSDATGWRWVDEAEYRAIKGLGSEDDFLPSNMVTPSSPMTDQFAYDLNRYGNPAWEDGTIPNYSPGTTITPQGVYPPTIEQRQAQGWSGGLSEASRGYGVSKDIEDRRNYMPPPIPAPAPTAVPGPQVRIIGGQIVRF